MEGYGQFLLFFVEHPLAGYGGPIDTIDEGYVVACPCRGDAILLEVQVYRLSYDLDVMTCCHLSETASANNCTICHAPSSVFASSRKCWQF